ncbi:hypothetical protein, partial [Burkholderia sp. BDU5]|uniref:hypothetical protein n=1 Tax=Burkholderia sp. BDU5 TaxID=1385590 RepID=UPI001E48E459
ASGIRSVATPQTSSSKHGHFKRSIPKRRRLVSDLDRRSQHVVEHHNALSRRLQPFYRITVPVRAAQA